MVPYMQEALLHRVNKRTRAGETMWVMPLTSSLLPDLLSSRILRNTWYCLLNAALYLDIACFSVYCSVAENSIAKYRIAKYGMVCHGS